MLLGEAQHKPQLFKRGRKMGRELTYTFTCDWPGCSHTETRADEEGWTQIWRENSEGRVVVLAACKTCYNRWDSLTESARKEMKRLRRKAEKVKGTQEEKNIHA
jgi:hypothetical protein